ncbi:MAG: hypothetical protein F4152_03630 [Dehalococcoidia bacterium]|nr:hypothetical protein [Dehalococcoidia bacterium]
MSSGGPSDDPVIGEEGGSADEIVEELRAAAEEAVTIAREGAKEKEEELWARYRELRKGRRERRER